MVKHIIGLGHKARNGKDTVADMIKDIVGDRCYIIHFADELYRQVYNKERVFPLIQRVYYNGERYFRLLDNFTFDHNTKGWVVRFVDRLEDEVPFLRDLMDRRGLSVYMGMDYKDAEMLQFWGTQFRRWQKENYWIDIVDKKINEIMHSIFLTGKLNEPIFFIVPDVRFLNELDYIDIVNGLFVEIARFKENGERFIDDSRDPNHQSEIELDNAKWNYYIRNDKTLIELKQKVIQFLNEIYHLGIGD